MHIVGISAKLTALRINQLINLELEFGFVRRTSSQAVGPGLSSGRSRASTYISDQLMRLFRSSSEKSRSCVFHAPTSRHQFRIVILQDLPRPEARFMYAVGI